MGFMAEQAAARFQKVSRRGEVPEWLDLAQYLALGVLAILVFVSLVGSAASDPPARSARLQAQPAPAASQPPASQPAAVPAPGELPSDTAPSVAPPPSAAGGVSVALLGETGSAEVPASAHALALQGAIAQLTGEYGQLPRSATFAVPAPGSVSVFPAATLGQRVEVVNPQVTGETSLVFSVEADPDGPGSQPATLAQVRVVLEGGRWVLG